MTAVETAPAPAPPATEPASDPGTSRLARLGRLRPPMRRPAVTAPSPPASMATWLIRIVGGLAVWLLVYAFLLSGLQEHRRQAVLYGTFREQLALETAPITGPIATGRPVAMLAAPVLGIKNLVIVEGTSSGTLRDGPGHRRDTVLPGQAGVSILYGRSATFGAPFGEISRFQAGDLIAVTTAEGQFNFKVADVRKAGDPYPPAVAVGGSRLVLETSDGSSWRAGFAPGHVLYVDADLTGTAVPAGRTSVAAGDEQAMDVSTSGLTVLVLWLEALALGGLAVVWAAARWGRWQTWVAGLPFMLFLLWGATSAGSALLPNLV